MLAVAERNEPQVGGCVCSHVMEDRKRVRQPSTTMQIRLWLDARILCIHELHGEVNSIDRIAKTPARTSSATIPALPAGTLRSRCRAFPHLFFVQPCLSKDSFYFLKYRLVLGCVQS